jgi:hypothetical protein
MRLFAIGIEYPFLVPVQRPHKADPRQHRRSAARCDEHRGFHRVLPFRRGMLGLWKLGDVVAGVLERHKLAAAGQVDRVVESPLPADGIFATNRFHLRFDHSCSTQRFGQGPTPAVRKIVVRRAVFSGGLCEQLRAGLGEFHVGAGFMQDEPAARNRRIEAGFVFGRTALEIEQKWPVDQFDKDAAFLRRLDRIGDLDQLAGGFSGSEYGRSVANFMAGILRCPRDWRV